MFFFCCCWRSGSRPSTQSRPRPSPAPVAGPCGLAGATQPGPHVSPPTQLPTPESKPSGAEVRRRHTLERVTARGEGNTWPGANLLCTLSLSLSCAHWLARSLALLFSQSLSHYFARPSPTLLTCSALFRSPTCWPRSLHFFFFFLDLCHTFDFLLRPPPPMSRSGRRNACAALCSSESTVHKLCSELGDTERQMGSLAFLLKVILALLLPATGDTFHIGESSAADRCRLHSTSC